MAIPVTGKICSAFGEITSPKFFYCSKFIGISPAGPGHIDLDIGEVGDEVVLSPVSDELVDVTVCDLNPGKVVFF
jgi:hypothetical protein